MKFMIKRRKIVREYGMDFVYGGFIYMLSMGYWVVYKFKDIGKIL